MSMKSHEHEHSHEHVKNEPSAPNLETIRQALRDAPLPARVQRRALTVFATLAEAEAAVHGAAVDDIHFHEVGSDRCHS